MSAARVLVVENVAPLRSVFARALESGGCTVFGAADLADAVEVARLTSPDVLMVDEHVISSSPDAWRDARRTGGFREALVVAVSSDLQRRSDLIARGAHCIVGKVPSDRAIMTAVEWVLGVYGDPRRES
jgi:CheY-like chemotaxis protein